MIALIEKNFKTLIIIIFFLDGVGWDRGREGERERERNLSRLQAQWGLISQA